MDKNIKYTTIPLDEECLSPQGIPPPAYEAIEGELGAAAAAAGGRGLDGEAASASGLQPYRSISPPPPLTPTHHPQQLLQNEDLYKCQDDQQTGGASAGGGGGGADGGYPSPPPYSEASAELPTYEEAQRTKMMEDEDDRQRQDGTNLFTRDNDILGTDFMFFISFFVAFLFNWIGFLLLLCFCHTLAARYGALGGFGLSLAKWTLLVKHSTDLVSSENEWLWWIIMSFGILICARATLQYIHAKREWRLLNPLTQDRLVFLY